MNTGTTLTGTETYQVVRGTDSLAQGSSALSNEFVVVVLKNGTPVGFLRRKDGRVRYFVAGSGARKAITRQLRGDFHR